jgi:hypothetical protein
MPHGVVLVLADRLVHSAQHRDPASGETAPRPFGPCHPRIGGKLPARARYPGANESETAARRAFCDLGAGRSDDAIPRQRLDGAIPAAASALTPPHRRRTQRLSRSGRRCPVVLRWCFGLAYSRFRSRWGTATGEHDQWGVGWSRLRAERGWPL